MPNRMSIQMSCGSDSMASRHSHSSASPGVEWQYSAGSATLVRGWAQMWSERHRGPHLATLGHIATILLINWIDETSCLTSFHEYPIHSYICSNTLSPHEWQPTQCSICWLQSWPSDAVQPRIRFHNECNKFGIRCILTKLVYILFCVIVCRQNRYQTIPNRNECEPWHETEDINRSEMVRPTPPDCLLNIWALIV